MKICGKLFDWALNNGARIPDHLVVRNDNYRGVFCTKDIPEGTEICYIPSNLLLSESVACESRIGKAVSAALEDSELIRDPCSLEIIRLACFMVKEVQNEESFWKSYLEELPKTFDLPVCWTREEIKDLLGNSPLEHATLTRLEWMDAVLEELKKHKIEISRSDFLWAYSAINSRVFPKKNTSTNTQKNWLTVSDMCLFPVLDLLNHKRGQKITWNMDEKGVSFVAGEDIKRGSEVFNNYGSKGNENFLLHYGFVLEENDEDYVKLNLNVSPQDPLVSKRLSLLKSLGLPQSTLLFLDQTELPEQLVSASRMFTMNALELRQVRKNPDFHTVKNDMTCLLTLYKLLFQKLRLLTQSPDIPNHHNPLRTKMARVYRNGQQRILEHAIELIKKAAMDRAEITKKGQKSGRFVTFAMMDKQCGESEENNMDEFEQLTIVLVDCMNNNQCEFYPYVMEMVSIVGQDFETCKAFLGSEECENFREFFTEAIIPMCGENVSKTQFMQAYAINVYFTGDYPVELLGGLSEYGIWLERNESRKKAKIN
jgi:hypothetical protein